MSNQNFHRVSCSQEELLAEPDLQSYGHRATYTAYKDNSTLNDRERSSFGKHLKYSRLYLFFEFVSFDCARSVES